MALINKKQVYFIAAAVLLLTSCVTQKYQQPVMSQQAQLYRDTSIVDSVSIATLPYTQLFADTVLQNLVAEGIRENLDLKTAVQRINEAQANVYQSSKAFLPGLDGNVSVIQNKQSIAALNFPPDFIGTFPLTVTTVQASISTSWEADIWGKLSSAKKAAVAKLLQTDAAKRAVQTQLIASIATYYYQLLSLDQQLKVTEQTLQNRIEEVKAIRTLKESAIVTGAAVVQSEANRYAAEVIIPDIKLLIRETENALSTLLARAPGAIKRATLAEQVPYTDLQVGVPSLLLKNRPDIQQAEFAFRAAFENTNLSRTYFYPQLTLTGELGISTLKIKNLFNRSVFYNVIGGLTQPIFNKGQNKARLRIAQAQQEQAYYAYQQSLLTAGQEVSNALYKYQTALEKQASRNNQLQALDKSVNFTRQLLRYSSATNYTDVLTSEQALLAAQLNSVNDRLQQLQAVVDLYKALGGGWQ
jgi:NodT family efflux transporter outer membrane factor (OMF) lipoprotein